MQTAATALGRDQGSTQGRAPVLLLQAEIQSVLGWTQL